MLQLRKYPNERSTSQTKIAAAACPETLHSLP
jgi:hypothetical protein